jgi:cell division protein FtsB
MARLPEPGAARRARRRRPEPPRRRSLLGRLAILALVPFVLYTLYTVAEKAVQTYRLRNDTLLLRAEVEAEKEENLRLQKELVETRGDQAIEDSARRYLNLVKPGDKPVVLVGASPPTPTPRPVARPELPDELPGWLTWLLAHLGL